MKKDINQTEFSVLQQVTGEVAIETVDPKKKVAQKSRRRGGLMAAL